ncbi:MAG: 1,2-phenylacetyl-CoA epoxidase subunit PaaC [Saprospiraceae bacterium]
MSDKELLYKYLLILGDNSMILGHRLSELCGHGPNLETDIALTNISLDFFGQVRSYFNYAAEVKGDGLDEDKVAFLRSEREYYNCILVEQENTDFAYVIVRQFLFDAFHKSLLEQLSESSDQTIAAIATKSLKESKYHLRFSSEWLKRLGDGTEESHARTQGALNDLYVYSHELFEETETERAMKEAGIGADLSMIKNSYYPFVHKVIEEGSLNVPGSAERIARGKHGFHSEKLGYILAELQYMQRAYPDMQW